VIAQTFVVAKTIDAMHEMPKHDVGRSIDWSKTSADYGAHRPGPPPSFYERLRVLGVGQPGQRILDLGTGTGLLARQFARQGCIAFGTDIADNQIAEAKQLAANEGLDVDFQIASSEKQPYPDHSFDCITAMQCWLYFPRAATIAEVKRLLKPNGILMTSHFSWLQSKSEIARASEALVLKFNPSWAGANYSGRVPLDGYKLQNDFVSNAMFWYDEEIPFTRESWRGRMRACRGTGATLAPDELARFDGEHAALLEKIAPPEFTIAHRLDAHFYVQSY
jgi:2-polyprenyl-3-methyl-5-hydroxy-6-metoxy-1,4-benzoquinol methylase